MFPYKRLLLKVTGSIAAYKSCELVSSLKAQYPDLEIKVVLSANAGRFVGTEALEALSGNPVSQDIFEAGSLMDHINLARWADAVLVYPASANTIASLAAGRADSLIGALFLAYELARKPYFVAPAMNTKMWEHPAQRKAISELSSYGVQVLPTESGTLACGEVGFGRLLSPEKTIAALSRPQSQQKNILISSGATREPIDGVRYLTNFSSGKTGAQLADYFSAQGHEVVLLHGQGAHRPESSRVRCHRFADFADLKALLFSLLESRDFHAIVHAAAVSDYSVDTIDTGAGPLPLKGLQAGKLETTDQIRITLKKNEKLLSRLKATSRNKNAQVVGFKLTKTVSLPERQQAIEKLLSQSPVDLVVHNDLFEIENGDHTFRIFDNQLGPKAQVHTTLDLGAALENLLFPANPATVIAPSVQQSVDL